MKSEQSKKVGSIVARDAEIDPIRVLKRQFPLCNVDSVPCDAIFKTAAFEQVIGVIGHSANLPILDLLFSMDDMVDFIGTFESNCSILICLALDEKKIFSCESGKTQEITIPVEIDKRLDDLFVNLDHWAGFLNSKGEHVVSLNFPAPGPHFHINLLLGNRIDDVNSLQATPKSVVDRFGRGSFRSHAATQVLAARWDLRAEENGFPANRQFYLLEKGKIIFYSGKSNSPNIQSAECTHSQNFTKIEYHTHCGLIIRRFIFILPHKKGYPLAVESQRVEIIAQQRCDNNRKLRFVYTGMFGTSAPHALWEDVLYSNIIMQAKIVRDRENNLIAVGSDYYPAEFKKDLRFHCTLAHTRGGPVFPDQFSFDYTEFVGGGTLEEPLGAAQLSNRINRKGPGFFAVGLDIDLELKQEVKIDNFTGMVSSPPNGRPSERQYHCEIETLLKDHLDPYQSERDLARIKDSLNQFCRFLQVKSNDQDFDNYFNRNLPFQVLYQTFVSRSFGQTQKGYREIGFREIQDLYASMHYFIGMGKQFVVKNLLRQWIENVYELGYANHNFFWEGKEPGKWSDDALWLIPAVYRYISLSGDSRILIEEFQVAGPAPKVRRKLIDTLSAIITYSAKISVGRHGFPLIDSADWNDCLKIDQHFIDGPEKEQQYHKQIAAGGSFGDPLAGDFSESIMNAFLLKHGIDLAVEMSGKLNDGNSGSRLRNLSNQLCIRLQSHAWKKDFYARVLLNRLECRPYTYIGAFGDGFSGDPAIPGTYFLNSFSWSILSDCATDQQVETMVATVESYLRSPYGLKLMTPAVLERVAAGTATGHYFDGDRENGAVFKHAAVMAVAALIKASKTVRIYSLARRMAELAYWMIDLVLPYNSLKDPFRLGGNPRFCTQYINSKTGENIGPLVSGTSSWLLLSLYTAYGLDFRSSGIFIDPILREEETQIDYEVNTGQACYRIRITKPEGFFRILDAPYSFVLDHINLNKNHIPLFRDNKEHHVQITFFSR